MKKIGLLKIVQAVSSLAVWLSVFISFYGVLSRNFVGSYPAFTEELPRYLIIWAVFLGAAETFVTEANIGLNWLVERMGRAKIFFVIFSRLAVLASTIILGATCWSLTSHQIRMHIVSQTTLAVPMYLVTLAIPVGSAFLVIYILKALFSDVSNLARRS